MQYQRVDELVWKILAAFFLRTFIMSQIEIDMLHYDPHMYDTEQDTRDELKITKFWVKPYYNTNNRLFKA